MSPGGGATQSRDESSRTDNVTRPFPARAIVAGGDSAWGGENPAPSGSPGSSSGNSRRPLPGLRHPAPSVIPQTVRRYSSARRWKAAFPSGVSISASRISPNRSLGNLM